MWVNKLIQDQIQTAAIDAIADILPSAINDILQQINKPEYTSWGRFLSTRQACQYLSVKSVGGLKTLLITKGIKPIKVGNKSKRYDRQELDKINTSQAIENYIKNI